MRFQIFGRTRMILGIMVFLAAGIFLSSCATVPQVPEGPPTDMIFTSPTTGPVARADAAHIISPGETAYRISKMYDVPLSVILSANRITDPKELRVGQRLTIPGAAPIRPIIPIFKSMKWSYIVVHHSVTDSGDATSLDMIHRNRGFDRGLGYHFVIDNGTTTKVDGQIEASPRWIKQMDGAHCNVGGMNECGIGVCLVGDFTYQAPTSRQMDSLVLLVSTLRRYYRVSLAHVIRHKDVPGKRTACPGDSFPWEEFKARLRRGV